MNISESFQNYRNGGNNYILKGDSKNRWVGFNKNTIDLLRTKFSSDFNLVIWGTKSETDYYCIPFKSVEHLFTEEHMTKGELADMGNARWTAIIEEHVFKMHANSNYSVNIRRFYGVKDGALPASYTDLDDLYDVDFTIEDAKANVKVRLGQSNFRTDVLENFEGKCCISGISEQSVLVASHIVPWAINKNYRRDPGNGLALFVEYDAYFDKGYISLNEKLNVIVTDAVSFLSSELQRRLRLIDGKKISLPVNHKIKDQYLQYHREHILMKRA